MVRFRTAPVLLVAVFALSTGGLIVLTPTKPAGAAAPPVQASELCHDYAVHALRFSPDGKILASRQGGEDHAICLWRIPSGKFLRQYNIDPEQLGNPHNQNASVSDEFSFLPGGRSIFLCPPARRFVRVIDLATGKTVNQLAEFVQYLGPVAVSPDGETAAVCAQDAVVLFSVKTGHRLRVLDPYGVTPRYNTLTSGRCVAFSPDGETLASAGGLHVHLWHYRTGKQFMRLDAWKGGIYAIAFSPDGNVVAAAGFCTAPDQLALWDIGSGTRIHDNLPLINVMRIRFSPDLVTFAVCDRARSRVHVRNLFTGKEIATLNDHDGAVYCLDFSPDGRLLATGGRDQSVYLYPTARFKTGYQPHRLTLAQLQAAWDDLARPEARTAYPAIWALRQAGDQAVAFLAARLRPAHGLDLRRVRRLIAELDADTFAAREAATKALAEIGPDAEADLRKAAAGELGADARRRVERLLPGCHPPWADGKVLQPLRGVQALEGIGTPEARALLRRLASGDAPALLTRQARASLTRLEQRPGP